MRNHRGGDILRAKSVQHEMENQEKVENHNQGWNCIDDSLTVITRITKQVSYFQESYSDDTDGNNGCGVQWQWHRKVCSSQPTSLAA